MILVSVELASTHLVNSNVNVQMDSTWVLMVELVQIQFKACAIPCSDKDNVSILGKWYQSLHAAVLPSPFHCQKGGECLVDNVQ